MCNTIGLNKSYNFAIDIYINNFPNMWCFCFEMFHFFFIKMYKHPQISEDFFERMKGFFFCL